MVLLLALACSRSPDPPPAATEGALEGGWIDVIVEDPAQFSALMAGDARDGWVRYHANDLPGAAASSGDARWRAMQDLSTFEADLSVLANYAWEQTFTEWEARSGLPAGSAIPVVAALNAIDSGDPARATAWLVKGTAYADPNVAKLAKQLQIGLKGELPEPPTIMDEESWAELTAAVERAPGPAACVLSHVQARRDGKREPLAACAGPLVQESGGTYTRTLHDPLVYGTLSAIYADEARAPRLSAAPLPSILFSEWWSEADRRNADNPVHSGVGEGLPVTWSALGLHVTSLLDADEPEPARAFVQGLDERLDVWAAVERGSAPPEGRELLDNLQLTGVYRSRTLALLARWLLQHDRPHQALTVLTLALDAEHGREIGPLNPPSLFALRAQALLRTGRAREALDSLLPLQAAYPEVAGLVATLEDLAVLQGMSRSGDSKEN